VAILPIFIDEMGVYSHCGIAVDEYDPLALGHLYQPIAAHGGTLIPFVYDVSASAERLRRSDVAFEHCSAWRTVVNDYDFALMLRCANEVVQFLEQNRAVVVVVSYEY
jgi:hypothetical protein